MNRHMFAGMPDAQKLWSYSVEDAARLMNRLSYSYWQNGHLQRSSSRIC